VITLLSRSLHSACARCLTVSFMSAERPGERVGCCVRADGLLVPLADDGSGCLPAQALCVGRAVDGDALELVKLDDSRRVLFAARAFPQKDGSAPKRPGSGGKAPSSPGEAADGREALRVDDGAASCSHGGHNPPKADECSPLAREMHKLFPLPGAFSGLRTLITRKTPPAPDAKAAGGEATPELQSPTPEANEGKARRGRLPSASLTETEDEGSGSGTGLRHPSGRADPEAPHPEKAERREAGPPPAPRPAAAERVEREEKKGGPGSDLAKVADASALANSPSAHPVSSRRPRPRAMQSDLLSTNVIFADPSDPFSTPFTAARDGATEEVEPRRNRREGSLAGVGGGSVPGDDRPSGRTSSKSSGFGRQPSSVHGALSSAAVSAAARGRPPHTGAGDQHNSNKGDGVGSQQGLGYSPSLLSLSSAGLTGAAHKTIVTPPPELGNGAAARAQAGVCAGGSHSLGSRESAPFTDPYPSTPYTNNTFNDVNNTSTVPEVNPAALQSERLGSPLLNLDALAQHRKQVPSATISSSPLLGSRPELFRYGDELYDSGRDLFDLDDPIMALDLNGDGPTEPQTVSPPREPGPRHKQI
jgi:hypothetical protein